MKGILVTIKGGEEAAKKEIKLILNIDSKIKNRCVEFEFDEYEQLIELCYFSQVAIRILLYEDYTEWLREGMSFRVRSDEYDKEREIGSIINKKNNYVVNLENPQIPIYYFDGKITIDFSGDISKRDYRIFTHRHTLKGSTAAILMYESGFDGKQKVLDPFTKDGTVALEFAHYSIKKSVRSFDWNNMNFVNFDKLKNIDFEKMIESFENKQIKNNSEIFATSHDFRDLNAIKKNSKIADVNKELIFARKDIEFLDQKFDKNELDLIVSFPSTISNNIWKEFYHQAEFISKKTVLLVDMEFKCENNYFIIEKEKILEIGKSKKKIVWLKKK